MGMQAPHMSWTLWLALTGCFIAARLAYDLLCWAIRRYNRKER